MQAANLSESLENRSLRLLGAAGAGVKAGAHNYAAGLLDQAEGYLSGASALAEVAYLRGRLAIGLTQPLKAPALLLAAARAFLPLDVPRTREVLLEAFDAYSISGRFTENIDPHAIVALASQTRATADPPALRDHLLDAMTALFSDDRTGAFEHYRNAGNLIRAGAEPDGEIAKWASFGTLVSLEMFDDATYNVWTTQTDGYARQNGALFVLLFNLFAQLHVDVRSGKLRAAFVGTPKHWMSPRPIGLPAEFLDMDNIVRAWSGDEAGTRTASAAAIEINSVIGSDQVVTGAHWALALLTLERGDTRTRWQKRTLSVPRTSLGSRRRRSQSQWRPR